MPKLSQFVATVGGLGHIPFAPGTFGSLAGLALTAAVQYLFRQVWGLSPLTFVLASSAVAITLSAVGYLAIRNLEKTWEHDDSRIVIDEVVGQFISSVWFPMTAYHLGLSFVLFRFFDILKPGPVRWVDEGWHGSFGTLADDLLAGVFAALVMVCFR